MITGMILGPSTPAAPPIHTAEGDPAAIEVKTALWGSFTTEYDAFPR
jgi:hypothetical protein